MTIHAPTQRFTGISRTLRVCASTAFLIGSIYVPSGSSAEEPFPCSSCFVGELKLSENPADPTGRTRVLDEDLYFIDLDKMAWKAGKGDVTDGASIPELFQPIIGGPWREDYLPAAVMHDHYTQREHLVRPWWTTDRMFYQAMLIRHVGFIRASVMYYAVYVFGPHWDKLEVGSQLHLPRPRHLSVIRLRFVSCPGAGGS